MNKILVLLVLLITPIILFSQDEPPEMPDGYSSMTMMKIAYFFGTLDLLEKDFPVPDDVKEYKDIVYKTIDSTKLKLDIYHSKNISKSAPLLVFIHGGAWEKGDKHDYLLYLVDYARKGYVTATIQYRFTDKVKFPEQLLDVNAAIIWLKKHADEYHIDKKNVAVIGGSAGGHLALMVGYSSDIPEFKVTNDSLFSTRVQAIVDLYGPADLTTEYAQSVSSVQKLIGKSYDDAPELYKKASPVTYITKDDPPTLIFHGTIDDIVPVEQSDTLKVKLSEAGVQVEYHRLEGWPHTMDLAVEVNEYCQYYMDKFFEKYLKKIKSKNEKNNY